MVETPLAAHATGRLQCPHSATESGKDQPGCRSKVREVRHESCRRETYSDQNIAAYQRSKARIEDRVGQGIPAKIPFADTILPPPSLELGAASATLSPGEMQLLILLRTHRLRRNGRSRRSTLDEVQKWIGEDPQPECRRGSRRKGNRGRKRNATL